MIVSASIGMLRAYTRFIKLPRRSCPAYFPTSSSQSYILTHRVFTMYLPTLATFIITASAAAVPSCARRGLFDLSSDSASLALTQPPVQMGLMRCMGICRLYPGCGGFASTGKKLPADWCFIFNAGVYGQQSFPITGHNG